MMSCAQKQAICQSCTGRLLDSPLSGLQKRNPFAAASRQRHVRHTRAACAADSAAHADHDTPGWLRGVKELFAPFHDRRANARFLALALGGLLCSVATLIHDSYLPIFMRNELGMTNTVRESSTTCMQTS